MAINAGIGPAELAEKGFPSLGEMIGGTTLGSIIALGGMASALGLYSAVLLSVSRIPKVMSDDGLLPAKLQALHPRYKSPYISILTCSVVVSFMVLWTFGELIIIDITLYGAALCIEYLALIQLRKTAATDHRPFKIPLNRAGLALMALLPFTVYVVALTGAFLNMEKALKPTLFALATLCSAEVVWLLVQWRKKGKLAL
jgi:amino acid transporter